MAASGTAGTSMLPVPAALTRGVSWRVIDINESELIATADDTGTAQVQTDYLQQGQYLRIERVVVLSGSANLCYVTLYQGDNVLAQRGRDWTPLPPGDVGVSEYPQFLTILPASCLLVNITGASPGDVFQVSYCYQLVQKVLNS